MRAYIEQLLTVPSTDRDDARRGRLLNIMLLAILLFALLGLIAVVLQSISDNFTLLDDERLLLFGIMILTLGFFGVYQVNRRVSGRLASLLFLLLLTAIFLFTDSPAELAEGRSLFLFTIPIAISSLILAPQASFLFAGISSAVIGWLAVSIGLAPNIFVISGFFVLALVSWLSARSLEQALQELRSINANLDQVVIKRTEELADPWNVSASRLDATRPS